MSDLHLFWCYLRWWVLVLCTENRDNQLLPSCLIQNLLLVYLFYIFEDFLPPPFFFSNAIINIYIFSVILDSRHFLDPYEFSAPVVPGNKLYCQNKEHDNATYLVGTLKIIAVIWSIHLFSLTQPVTCTSSQGCGTGLPDLLGRAADSQPANGVALLLWLLTHLQLGADPWPCRHQAAGTVPCPDTSLRV